MPLDPEAAAFLAACNASELKAIWEVPVAEARANVLPVPGPQEEVGRVRDNRAPGPAGSIPVRIYEPRTTPLGTVVYFHGGGWVTGSLDTHDALCRRLCNDSQSQVVAVDYRLAPEHKFPAAIEDACAATVWAMEACGGGRPLAVCGDSAGGNLAGAVCLMTRDRSGPAIAAQALVYPITNYAFDTRSYARNAEGYFLTRKQMEWFWKQYLEKPSDGANPLASLLRADDLSGLPPALIVTAEYDVLRDEGEAYAVALADAGVPVSRLYCEGMIHAFLRRLNLFRRAGEVCREMGEFLREQFAAGR